MQVNSPVSSLLRNRSDGKSATDGKDLPSAKVVAVSPRKLSPRFPYNAKPSAFVGGAEHGSQTECFQPKSDSAVVRPADSICRVSEDTSFPVTIDQNTSSPKFSPVSSHGSVRISGSGQPQRASFRLVVNLQSPKSEHIRRLSSDTSLLEDAGSSSDAQKRPICPGYQSPKHIYRSSPLRSSPLQQCRDLSAQPRSERKLRPRPQKDAPARVRDYDSTQSAANYKEHRCHIRFTTDDQD